MPPKKSTSNGDATDAGGPFKWEGPNDTKLLLLTQGRWVKPDEYPNLSSAFPGTSIGSIRNRISTLRVKQRDLYLALSWDLPEGGVGHSAKKTAKTASTKKLTSRKRGADAVDDEEEEEEEVEMATPSKKPRVRKGKGGKKEEVVEEECNGELEEDVLSGGDDAGVGVKEEVFDEVV